MAFTAKDVAELRKQTGCGMMDCKKALTETNGDVEKAMDFLREKGLATAEKKAGRIAAEGLVCGIVDNDKKIGVLLEVNSETDFVASNDEFKAFANKVAEVIAAANPADVDALMAAKDENGKTVKTIVEYTGDQYKDDPDYYAVTKEDNTVVYYKVLRVFDILPEDFFERFAKYVVEDAADAISLND